MQKVNFIVKMALMLGVLAVGLIAADTIPTRIPPLPPSPKTKSEQARVLREAAAILESEDRALKEELRQSISNRIQGVEFSTDKTDVKISTIQFSEWNGDLMVTVTFNVLDK